MTSHPGDVARASVFVAIEPAEAFRVFVDEIDQWWRRGPRFRVAAGAPGIIRIEPGVGGRLYEAYQVDGHERVFESGRVLEWAPPSRLVLEWWTANFGPDERTRVEIDFVVEDEGTRVTVFHRGWAALAPDHPVRHAESVESFIARRGRWWGICWWPCDCTPGPADPGPPHPALLNPAR